MFAQIWEFLKKEYKPKANEGRVRYHMESDSVDLAAEGSWLLLGRNVALLNQLVSMVRSQGRVYNYRGESAVNKKHAEAILAWERYRKGAEPSPDEREAIEKHLGRKDRWPDTIWHEALVKIPRLDREWYISVLRRKGSLTKPARIDISTIHGVKGGEADNVMIMSDMSPRTWRGYQSHPDAEHRCWYVGVTRARQNLDIVLPQGRMFYDL